MCPKCSSGYYRYTGNILADGAEEVSCADCGHVYSYEYIQGYLDYFGLDDADKYYPEDDF